MDEEIKTRQEVIESIREFFEDNEEVFNSCVEDLDSCNGWLNDDRYYYMEELHELYYGVDPVEILTRAFYGYDEETWHTDSHGEKEYGAFNPNHEFFRYNGYGNLVSCNYKDYSDYLTEETIEKMAEHRKDIWGINDDEDLKELFDMLEQTEDE